MAMGEGDFFWPRSETARNGGFFACGGFFSAGVGLIDFGDAPVGGAVDGLGAEEL